mgnify:CR=1 FL=1
MRTRVAARRVTVAVIAALSLSLTASISKAEEWRIDLHPEATRIEFELGATMHTVTGTATLGAGSLVLDPRGGVASGRIVVAAASLDTGHKGRDRKMHDQVLESETFPDIVFEPLAMSGELFRDGESRLTVEGIFTIHGDSHPLSLEIVVRRDGDTLTAETEFEVPYVAWGMKDPSRFVMRAAKEVRVRITATVRPVPVVPGAGG